MGRYWLKYRWYKETNRAPKKQRRPREFWGSIFLIIKIIYFSFSSASIVIFFGIQIFKECRKSISESARKFVLYDQKHICAKGLGNLCQGDSGSPLICYPQRKGKCGKAILAGIATQADQCSSTTPGTKKIKNLPYWNCFLGIFTSVEKLFHWIKSTIRSETDVVFNSTMVCQTAQCWNFLSIDSGNNKINSSRPTKSINNVQRGPI